MNPRRPRGWAVVLIVLALVSVGGAGAALVSLRSSPSRAVRPRRMDSGPTTPHPTLGRSPGTRRAAPTGTATPVGCQAAVARWPVSRLAAQTVTVPAPESDPVTADPMVAAGAGGVILFGSYAPVNLGPLLAGVAARGGATPPVVMVDEEGGLIQRVANLVGSMPWPRQMAATMSPGQVQAMAASIGARMAALGIRMDLAPVLDLDGTGVGPDNQNPDGSRSFSGNPQTATAYGLAFARGLLSAGVTPVVKHFPGLGGVGPNTDVATGYTHPLPTVQNHDILPFRAAVAAGMPAVMVSNAIIPGLSPHPASMSMRATTGLLRDELGFRGLVVTDALNAQSIVNAGYNLGTAAPRALAVGADLLLYNSAHPAASFAQMVGGIEAAVSSGQLPLARLQQAARHVLAAKGLDGCTLH